MRFRIPFEKFIDKFNYIHKNKYDYSKANYINSRVKILIICPIHGSFLMTPHNHCVNGCPQCGGTYKMDKDMFIRKAQKIHGSSYNYFSVQYINRLTLVSIMCPTHGPFHQKPKNHLKGNGCPSCGGSSKLNTLSFIDRANKIHNNRYSYENSQYFNTHTKLQITCQKHGIFYQTPAHHLQGRGCPKCKFSKGELKILDFMKLHNISFEYQKTFQDCINPDTGKILRFDFYIPHKKLLIEFDGEQHFTCRINGYFTTSAEDLLEIQFRDSIKNNFATSNGFTLLRIKFTQIKHIHNILTEKLLECKGGTLRSCSESGTCT